VTVKYLRLDRYHQRFPQAEGCLVPLRPSGGPAGASPRHHSRASTSSLISPEEQERGRERERTLSP
jgi:hypothetical protein